MKTYLDLFLNEYESAGTRKVYSGIITDMFEYIDKDICDIKKIDLVEYKNTFKNLATARSIQQ